MVPPICMGSLTVGPLQCNLSPEKGSDVLAYAFGQGIDFVDTAQLYKTYEYIRLAVKKSGVNPVISSKSYAYDRKTAMEAFEEARKALDRDYIDIFMLHEQESRMTLRGHREALEFYLEMKQRGLIRAVGVSTHNVCVVEAAAEMDEIDVIHPIFNIRGVGINDGTSRDMEKAVERAYGCGKGIFTMKPLGGGSLIDDYDSSMGYVMGKEYIHSVAIGMSSTAEVDMNIAVFEGREPEEKTRNSVSLQKRELHIEFWCENCGACIERCRQGALSPGKDRPVIDSGKCVVCGYCCSVCPVFALKIF